MKDDILDLIRSYTRRVDSLVELHEQANDNLSKVRLAAKKSAYEQIIIDLKHIVKDNEDCS